MSDHTARGFLQDILSNPDDDAPRLIFADWLEDKGDAARAEFIRAQIERASLPEWDARRVRLLLRERALLEQHGKQWKKELPTIKGVSWGEFRRGFVATAVFSQFSKLETCLRECWSAAPIESVAVRWPRHHAPRLRITQIPALRELCIQGNLVDPREADQLADTPLLSTVRKLFLGDVHLGLEGFRRLLASSHLENLTALLAPHNSLGNAGVAALCDCETLPALEELDLSEAGSYGRYGEDPIIDSDGAEMLANWPGLAQVRSLSLSGNDLRQDGLRVLLESPNVTGLKTLALRGNGLTGPSMAEFGAAGSALRLDILDLGENVLRNEGAEYLAKAPCLRELKMLTLDRCEMRMEAARKLAKAPFLATLRSLNANYNSFGSKGLAALLGANPPELHRLTLIHNDLGAAGATWLAQSPATDVLLELDLTLNAIDEKSVQALLNSDHLKNLLVLRLHGNSLPKKAAGALTRTPLGQRLALLDVAW